MTKLKETLQSRKFWFAIIGAIIPVLNQEMGLNLDPVAILAMSGAIIAWILGEAHIDSAKIKNGNGNNHNSEKPEVPVVSVETSSETIEKLNSSHNVLTAATAEMYQLEKNYKERKVSLFITLAAIEAWKVKYPDWKHLVPPGFPGLPPV